MDSLLKLRVNRFAVAIFIYIVGVFIVALVSYQQERARFLADIDGRLLAAASHLPDILPPNFHDIARSPDAISAEQDRQNLELLTQHANTGSLTYLYTYVMVDGMIYFTSCNYLQSDIERNKVVTYWTDYPEGAQQYFDAMSAEEPVYVTAADTWGLFRTILIPLKSPNGLPYVAAADMDISVIESSLRDVVLFVLGMGAILLALALPLVFAYRATYLKLNGKLVELNTQLKKDIVQAQQLELELKQATKQAQVANEIKDQFLSNMSHELRTPINGITGTNQLLLDTELNAEQLEYVELCNKSANVLLDTVNQILDVATIEAGGLTLKPESVDTEVFFDDVVSLFSSQIAKKQLDLVISYIGSVPQQIIIDPVNFRKVLINLISNAIKFTRSGGIHVLLSWRDGVLTGEVRDTGMGIPETFQGKIFEAFQQADNSYAREYGGTGLGLPISRQICRFMGGEMFLHASNESGSVFKFFVQAPAKNELLVPTLFKNDSKILVCADSSILHSWLSSQLGTIDVSQLLNSDFKAEDIAVEMAQYDLIVLDTLMSEEDKKKIVFASNPAKQCTVWLTWLGQELPADLPDNTLAVVKPLRRSSLISICNFVNALKSDLISNKIVSL